MFTVIFCRQAAKKLEKISKPYFSLIEKEILSLQNNYFSGGKNCKRLQGKERDLYRLRTGVYRILYYVDRRRVLITVLKIFHRNEGY